MTRPHPEPRQDDAGRLLLSRHAVAYLQDRHIDHVRKAVPAVACDVATRAALVDLDEAARLLAARRQRARRT